MALGSLHALPPPPPPPPLLLLAFIPSHPVPLYLISHYPRARARRRAVFRGIIRTDGRPMERDLIGRHVRSCAWLLASMPRRAGRPHSLIPRPRPPCSRQFSYFRRTNKVGLSRLSTRAAQKANIKLRGGRQCRAERRTDCGLRGRSVNVHQMFCFAGFFWRSEYSEEAIFFSALLFQHSPETDWPRGRPAAVAPLQISSPFPSDMLFRFLFLSAIILITDTVSYLARR